MKVVALLLNVTDFTRQIQNLNMTVVRILEFKNAYIFILFEVLLIYLKTFVSQCI